MGVESKMITGSRHISNDGVDPSRPIIILQLSPKALIPNPKTKTLNPTPIIILELSLKALIPNPNP